MEDEREPNDYAARSRRTRRRLLEASVEALIELGYAGASTLAIQKRAKMSRGRLLHQFPHRDALLVAASQHLAEERVRETRERQDWPSDLGERSDAAIEAMWSTYRQGYFWAATELWVASRHNETLAASVLPGERTLGAAVRTAIDDMFGSELASRPHYAETRDVINTSMRGVALTYGFDPGDPTRDPHVSAWKRLARRNLVDP